MALRRLYLDTNILVRSFEDGESPSGRLVRLAARGLILVLKSDYLVDEVERVFVRVYGQRVAQVQSKQLRRFPASIQVPPASWRSALFQVEPSVRDVGDGPHFAAALAGNADALVSTNRRSILPSMFDLVPLAEPEDVLPALLGEEKWPTVTDLRGRWEVWAKRSTRGPR